MNDELQNPNGKRGGVMDEMKPRILCVDDEPQILKLFEGILVSNGYEVVKGNNGEEALEKIRSERIDLVLSDVTMPKMDGFELCRQIKGDERYRDIPVVMVTGLTAKEERVKGIEAGAEDFISKPIDATEVLARVRMLLKVREEHERNIGQLLIDMGFITEEQLQEGLILAKEENMKVGEALYSLGILDKDRLYWVLSTQLKMNYVELSPEMMDQELIRQFPMDVLEELLCLPLYETGEEIHFAMADPTDLDVVRSIKGLRPGKRAQIHLALPERILEILKLFQQEGRTQLHPSPIIPFEGKPVQVSVESASSEEISTAERFLNDFISILLSMSKGDAYWLYRTPHLCRLFSQKGMKFTLLEEYPEEIYSSIKERLGHYQRDNRLFIHEESTKWQGAFKWMQVDCLDGEMIGIEQIPVFSWEDFSKSHPQIPSLIKDLQQLFHKHRHLLIGSKDRLFVKQCCYALLMAEDLFTEFPPPIFVEGEIDIYFPGAAQLTKRNGLEIFRTTSIPFLFCEIEFEKTPGDLFSGNCQHTIFYHPFSTIETMKEALSTRQDWRQAGFKTLFFEPYQWKMI
jgi:CheY-like chemotaxis protein